MGCWYMTAIPNDDLSMLEIRRLVEDIHYRIDAFEITEDVALRPKNKKEEALIDVVFMSVYRLLEEANSLSFEVKSEYSEVPWDAVRGMRNRLAHDYSHVDRAVVWETISDGIDELGRIAGDYVEKRGLER